MIDTSTIKSDGQRPGHMILADHLRERGWTILTIKSHDVEPTAQARHGDTRAWLQGYRRLRYATVISSPTATTSNSSAKTITTQPTRSASSTAEDDVARTADTSIWAACIACDLSRGSPVPVEDFRLGDAGRLVTGIPLGKVAGLG